MPLETVYSSAPLGHEIRGVDLSQDIDQNVFQEIENTFNQYGVVVFRDQRLTPEQHIAFSRRFGQLEQYPLGGFVLPGYPEVLVVSNIVEDGKPIGLVDAGRNWHSDMTYVEKPPRCSLLYALEVPHADEHPLGDTLFASTAAAYDALPEDMKRSLAGLSVVNSFSTYSGRKTDGRDKDGAKFPNVVHPLIRTHPMTGRPCLYLSESVTIKIGDFDDAETRNLIGRLIEHITKPEFVYRHRWRVGDLVIWDNCSSMHKAMHDYQLPQRRRMHRTTVEGTRPF